MICGRPIVELIASSVHEWQSAAEFAQLVADLPELATELIGVMAETQKPSPGKKARKAIEAPDRVITGLRRSKRTWTRLPTRYGGGSNG